MGVGINLIKDNKIICLIGISHSEIEEFNKVMSKFPYIPVNLLSKCIIDNHLIIPSEINFEEGWAIINKINIIFF